MTLEDFPRYKKDAANDRKKGDLEEAACIVVLNELLVKYDLISNREKKISLVDWVSYDFKNDWKFCFCQEKELDSINKEKENHYYSMRIKPDGCFEVKEVTQEFDNEFSLCDEIFALNNMNAERHNRYDEKYRGLVINSDGETNIIQETSYFMLPSVDETYMALKTNGINKKKETLEKLFAACFDIYYKKSENEKSEYYSVGQIGTGINQLKIERSARVRKIISPNESRLFFRDVLDTMNVIFVRHGQLTVMPFPFKYLREWVKLNATM